MKKLWMTICLGFCFVLTYGQEATTAAGGSASGSGGIVTYSIGQLFYTTDEGSDGSVAKGVQHAYEIFSVGLDETIWSFSLEVFPNPTTDLLTLKIDNFQFEELAYELYNVQGQLLSSGRILEDRTKVDFSKLSAGFYLLKINSENRSVQTFKIIKN